MSLINKLTDIADQAVVLPLIVVIAAMLAAQGWRRGATAWIVSSAATFGTMLVLKLIFLGCGGTFGATSIVSPSGHAASAALVTGGLFARAVFSIPMTLVAALTGGVIIGYTRVHLGLHTIEEVIVGIAVGTAGAFGITYYSGYPPSPRPMPLMVVMVAVVLAFHGYRLPAEPVIQQGSALLYAIVPWCTPSVGSLPPLAVPLPPRP